MITRQYNVFDADYRHDAVGGYVTPEHERRRHPEYRRQQEMLADRRQTEQVEEFIDIVGEVLGLSEQLAGSYGQVLPEVFRERAVALRECAVRLVEFAGRMR